MNWYRTILAMIMSLLMMVPATTQALFAKRTNYNCLNLPIDAGLAETFQTGMKYAVRNSYLFFPAVNNETILKTIHPKTHPVSIRSKAILKVSICTIFPYF